MSAFTYITDPATIYAESFLRISQTARLDHLPADVATLVTRLIHACGMPDLVDDLSFSDNLVKNGVAALAAGKPIFCDCEMVASGITRRFLPADNSVIVTLNDPQTPDLAKQLGTTRSAAAVDLWDHRLDGAIVAVGNAPTALFRLLEHIAIGRPSLGFQLDLLARPSPRNCLLTSHVVPNLSLFSAHVVDLQSPLLRSMRCR